MESSSETRSSIINKLCKNGVVVLLGALSVGLCVYAVLESGYKDKSSDAGKLAVLIAVLSAALVFCIILALACSNNARNYSTNEQANNSTSNLIEEEEQRVTTTNNIDPPEYQQFETDYWKLPEYSKLNHDGDFPKVLIYSSQSDIETAGTSPPEYRQS